MLKSIIKTGIGIFLFITLSEFSFASILSSFEKSLMPGELAKVHEELVDDCSNCHGFFQKDKQNQFCMDCHDHKSIKLDIKNNTGLHGRYPGLKEKPCKDCHSEHRGVDHELALFDEATFNHTYTDFSLNGKHKNTACESCHKEEEPYRKAKSECIDCHKKEQPHEGRLGEKCNACHSEKNWLEFRFDHEITKYKLTGKHQLLACVDCHVNESYVNTPKDCIACHKQLDKHDNLFGEKCDKCHTTVGFSKLKFNHDKHTKFKRNLTHKELDCEACHTENPFKKKPKQNCFSCHKKDDRHKGLYGEKCKNCHIESKWKKVQFDHDKTDFTLRGKHKTTPCGQCHTGELYNQDLPLDCYDCHIQHDVHQGNQGKKCQSCHNEKDWLDRIQFNHKFTNFPLLGSHAGLSCEDCHSDNNFKQTKHTCINCHQNDDIHKKTLGEKCETCHLAKDWKAWRFDHNKQTQFELNGQHGKIECKDCHKAPVKEKISLSTQCISCHLIDDIHEGQFGRACKQCHKPESFSKVNVN